MKRVCFATGVLLAVLAAWAAIPAGAADEEPSVVFKCVPAKPRRTLDSTPTEAWVAELREGPVSELEEAGEKAAPILAAAMRDPKAADWARHMLTFTKGDRKWTVPVLAAGLSNPDRTERFWALWKLKDLGPDAAPAVPAIVAALKSWCLDGRLRDEEERNGEAAIELLGKIGPDAREAVELLVTIFESEPSMPTPGRGSCRFEVMKTLGQIGPAAVPALLDMVGRYTEDPQGFSIWTCLTYYRPETLRPVFEQLSSDQVPRRRAAAGIVAVFVRDKQRLPADKELAAALASLLEDADEQVRQHALNALLKIPQEAAAAIPLLVSWLQGDDTKERFAAAEALAKIGPAALPALRDAAGSQNADVRRAAVYGIGEMKPVPQSEVPLLLALAADKVPGVQGFALASLGRARDARPEVVGFLIEALDDPVIRYGAAEALGELGPGASAALSKLTAQLSTVGPQERVSVAKSIWQIDAASPAVFPALIEVLRDTRTVCAGQELRNREVDGKIVVAWGPLTEPVSCCAANVLREMGPAAAPAVQALIEVAKCENRDAALSAVGALHAIGPAAGAAVPALNELTRSEDFYLARAAREAVLAIEGKPAPIATGTIFSKQD